MLIYTFNGYKHLLLNQSICGFRAPSSLAILPSLLVTISLFIEKVRELLAKVNIDYLFGCYNCRSFAILSLASKRLLDLPHHGFCGSGMKYECLLVAWSRVIDKSYLALILAKFFPRRYSTFLVLYPTGISSEVGLIYIALPFIKVKN